MMLVPVLFAAMQLRLAASWRPGLLHLPATVMLFAAACGFFLVLVLQGKGWPYQGYPMLALAYNLYRGCRAQQPRPAGAAPAHGEGSPGRNGGGRLRDLFLVEPRQ